MSRGFVFHFLVLCPDKHHSIEELGPTQQCGESWLRLTTSYINETINPPNTELVHISFLSLPFIGCWSHRWLALQRSHTCGWRWPTEAPSRWCLWPARTFEKCPAWAACSNLNMPHCFLRNPNQIYFRLQKKEPYWLKSVHLHLDGPAPWQLAGVRGTAAGRCFNFTLLWHCTWSIWHMGSL